MKPTTFFTTLFLFVTLLLWSFCAPTNRKAVSRPESGGPNTTASSQSAGANTAPHIVPEVVAADEKAAADANGSNEIGWQTPENNPGAAFKDILFEYNLYAFPPSALETLGAIAKELSKRKELKLLIEGHCDARGSEEYNLALGEKRAQAVATYFLKYGIAQNRLSTISYGEERPKNNDNNENGWAENRRVHFEVMK